MGTSLFILAVSISCGLAAATEVPEKQWLTREDLQLAMNAFSKELQHIQNALNDEREANQRNRAEIVKLQDKVRQLEEKTKHGNDADDTILMEETETGVKEHGIRNTEQIRTHNAGRVQNRRSKRFVLGEGVEIPVAFSVSLSDPAQGEHLGAHQIIHFDKVITNLGNKFDSRLGVFTAPVSGWYAFSVTLMSRPNETQQIQLVNNGTHIFHCYSQGNEFNTASRTMVVRVEKGSEVWVETTTSIYSSNVHGSEHTSFSGWLLYAN